MTPGGVVTVLHAFTGGTTDGSQPWGPLIQATDGNLYGVTGGGGSASEGTLFELNFTSHVITIVHSFGAAGDGQQPPCGLLQGADGNLYGVTFYGGNIGGTASDAGTIYSYGPIGG